MKKIIILGSTGSIGRQAVEVIESFPDLFRVVGLSAHSDTDLLLSQTVKLKPNYIAVTNPASARAISDQVPNGVKLLLGEGALSELATCDADMVLNALVGAAGLTSTISALKAKRQVALANKESLVIAGDLINDLLDGGCGSIIPVDSEHSAIEQCLLGEDRSKIERIIITASGGPFRGFDIQALKGVTVEMALSHPKWKMGPKITIDSATLMNKGLEVIEAHHLFRLPYDRIDVLVHPQSIVHSMVEFEDGSIKAHLGPADMRIPIQYALTYPRRAPFTQKRFDPINDAPLTFEEPDLTLFPCLAYAREAGLKGSTFPAVLNASNEVAVKAFLNKKINFIDIPKVIYNVLTIHQPLNHLDMESLLQADRWARKVTTIELSRLGAVYNDK